MGECNDIIINNDYIYIYTQWNFLAAISGFLSVCSSNTEPIRRAEPPSAPRSEDEYGFEEEIFYKRAFVKVNINGYPLVN